MDIIFDIDFYCKTANRSRQNRSKEQKELIKEMTIFCKDNLSGLRKNNTIKYAWQPVILLLRQRGVL